MTMSYKIAMYTNIEYCGGGSLMCVGKGKRCATLDVLYITAAWRYKGTAIHSGDQNVYF